MAGIKQVFGGATGAAGVVGDDGVGPGVGNHPVERHDRNPHAEQAADLVGGGVIGDENDPLDALLGDHVQTGALAIGGLVGRAEDDAEATGVGDGLDDPDHLGEVRVLDIRDDHADRGVLLAPEVAGLAVGPVIQLGGSAEHSLPRGGIDARRSAERARDRRGRDPSQFGDLFQLRHRISRPRQTISMLSRDGRNGCPGSTSAPLRSGNPCAIVFTLVPAFWPVRRIAASWYGAVLCRRAGDVHRVGRLPLPTPWRSGDGRAVRR